jgi:MFS family permease
MPKILLTAQTVDAVGSGCSAPLMLLFLTTQAGIRVGTAGAILSITGLVTLVVPALVGRFIDRLGPRTVVIWAQVVQAVAFADFLVFRSLVPLIIGAALAAIGQRMFWSSIFGLIARDGDGHAFAWSGMVRAGGFAVGALISGMLLSLPGGWPYAVGFSANAASFVISAVLLLRVPDTRPEPAEHTVAAGNGTFFVLTAANTLFALCSVLLGIGLPIYVARALPAPVWMVGPLLALVTIVGATCQAMAVRAVRHIRRTRVLAASGAIWCLWGLCTAGLVSLPGMLATIGLVISVLLYSVAELLHAPTSNALVAAAAPPAATAQYLAYFQYSFALATIIAPGAFGLLFAQSHALPWLVIALLAAIAAVMMLGLEKHLPAAEPRKVPAAM